MIQKIENTIFLNTENTGYILQIKESGHIEHLHYGEKIRPTKHVKALVDQWAGQPGNCINYDPAYPSLVLEHRPLEMSSVGKGDVREPFLRLTYEDGSTTSDFLYHSVKIQDGKTKAATLPTAYGEPSRDKDDITPGKADIAELILTLKDRDREVYLDLYYTVFERTDVITKRSVLRNESGKTIKIERLMSGQLDFHDTKYVAYTFGGAWTREMNRFSHTLNHGRVINQSSTGNSSNLANPFTMLAREDTSEEYGECYGFNLIYSGNHYTSFESESLGKLRVLTGINPEGFSYLLTQGEFEAPEAVMTFSKEGFRGMSKQMHRFIREHIVRGEWQKKERPILLNSWEAAYFDISESVLLKMAKAAKKVGIELFVVDDGWFKNRSDDQHALGDWEPDLKKLPGGIQGLSDKIHELGLQFGIWVEPEMISEESELYKAHPEYAMKIPGRHHSVGRNQMILDLTKKEVREFIVDAMSKVFSAGEINYVKWDMNRIFSDTFSDALAPNQQGEVFHRYILGLYEVMGRLTEKFPHILFEGCSSGGNRFDLGILCYMPQIWASDDTDPYARAGIQTGYSYGYPQSVLACHVSGSPNHQTLRCTSMETRFHVAAFGVLGYELNPAELSKGELSQMAEQITFYKKHRKVLQFGQFYRHALGEKTDFENGIYQWQILSDDKSSSLAMVLQGLVIPNNPYLRLKICDLKEESVYHFENRRIQYNIKEFGDLINTVLPFHVKKDSLVHNAIAMLKKMDSEIEDGYIPGDMANRVGIRLKQSYIGTGYDENTRLFKDFESRVYTLTEKAE